jgi:hypothetical protein
MKFLQAGVRLAYRIAAPGWWNDIFPLQAQAKACGYQKLSLGTRIELLKNCDLH